MRTAPPPYSLDLGTDSHVHTSLCNHASGSMEEYVQAAINKGLETLVFLEHMEAGIEYFERTWLTRSDFVRYFAEGKLLQEKYRGRIKVQLGVEVGYNPAAVDVLKELLKEFPWDLKGLSYHFFSAGGKHLNMVSRRQQNIEALAAVGVAEVITGYLAGLIEAVGSLDCQVLCHLDAVMRHYPGLHFNPSHLVQVEQLLGLMHKKNMRLEVNTSGFPLRSEPYPGRTILARAMKMGIPLSAGSDAHRPDQVGRHFDELPEFLSGIREPVNPDPADNIEPAA